VQHAPPVLFMGDQQQALIQTLALVIDRLGYSIPGGKEVFISDEKLTTIPATAQVQVERHPTEPGYCVRYFSNQVIDIAPAHTDSTIKL
jgi:hypothetical protein